MPETHPIVDRSILTRLVGRLAPYVREGGIRRSRLDRVVRSVASDESFRADLEARAVAALKSAGITVEEDVPEPIPAAAAPTPPPAGHTPVDHSIKGARESDEPATDGGERIEVDHDQAVAQARRFLRRTARLRHPERVLLTAELEVGLALLMRADGTPLSQDLPDDYRRHLPDGGEAAQAFDALVVHNIRLAWSIAQRYTGQAELLELDDVAAYGYLGLIRAVQKYDAGKGFKFSTYATWWIRQSITRAIADHGRLIRIPVHMCEKIHKTRAAHARLLAANIKPTLSRLAAETGFDENDISWHFQLMQGIHSLDTPVGEDDGATIRDFLMSRTAQDDGIGGIDLLVLRMEIQKLLADMTEREAGIVRMRFGFSDGETSTLDEIGSHYGVTRERIRQIEKKALDKLKAPAASARLRHWVQVVDEEPPTRLERNASVSKRHAITAAGASSPDSGVDG